MAQLHITRAQKQRKEVLYWSAESPFRDEEGLSVKAHEAGWCQKEECTKRGSVLKTNKCMKKMMAKVIISGDDGKKHVVTMFNDIVSKVIDGISGDGQSVKLLMANIHKFSIDARDAVFLVQKQ